MALLLHRGIPYRARTCRVDIELPLKLLRHQNHRALRESRDRQERADANCRGYRSPIAHVEPIVNASRPFRWIKHPTVRRYDTLLHRFTHCASAERMGNDPVAAERSHGEGIADEHTTRAFDHGLDLLLCFHALRRVAVARPVDNDMVVLKPQAATRIVVRDDVEDLRSAHLVAVDTFLQ